MQPHTLLFFMLLSHVHVKICIKQKEWCILPLNCMSCYITCNYKNYKAECRGFYFLFQFLFMKLNLTVCITIGFRLAQPYFMSRQSTALAHGTMLGCFRVVSGALIWVGGQASPFPLCSQAVNLFPRCRPWLWWSARWHGAATTAPARLCYIRK